MDGTRRRIAAEGRWWLVVVEWKQDLAQVVDFLKVLRISVVGIGVMLLLLSKSSVMLDDLSHASHIALPTLCFGRFWSCALQYLPCFALACFGLVLTKRFCTSYLSPRKVTSWAQDPIWQTYDMLAEPSHAHLGMPLCLFPFVAWVWRWNFIDAVWCWFEKGTIANTRFWAKNPILKGPLYTGPDRGIFGSLGGTLRLF